VAGEGSHADVFRCSRQRVDEAIARGIYAPVDMSPYRETLEQIFPAGVCDYARADEALPSQLLMQLRDSAQF